MIPQILIVDDEPNVRLNYRTTLETENYDAVEAGSAALALKQLEKWKFELAILDMQGGLIFALFWIQRCTRGAANRKTKPPQNHD